MHRDPKTMLVEELMQRNVYSIDVNSTVFDASVFMASKSIGSLPVIKDDGMEEDILVGIITDRDIVTRCIAVGKDPKKVKVKECMTSNPIRTVPSAFVTEAAQEMSELNVSRLPVVERDKLVGIISIADIACACNFCPNKKSPEPECILIDIANQVSRSAIYNICAKN